MEAYSHHYRSENPSLPSQFESKVLIWNSRKNEAESIEQRLHIAGFTNTHCATTYSEGLEYLQKEIVHVFLIDMELGKVDGLQLVRALRESYKYRYTPVLITTSSNQVEDTLNAMMAGANDLIKKPVSPELLRQKVSLHLKVSFIVD